MAVISEENTCHEKPTVNTKVSKWELLYTKHNPSLEEASQNIMLRKSSVVQSKQHMFMKFLLRVFSCCSVEHTTLLTAEHGRPYCSFMWEIQDHISGIHHGTGTAKLENNDVIQYTGLKIVLKYTAMQ